RHPWNNPSPSRSTVVPRCRLLPHRCTSSRWWQARRALISVRVANNGYSIVDDLADWVVGFTGDGKVVERECAVRCLSDNEHLQ
ncbi:hypothetical protein PENTCL1PPCAC_10334, partial [Pristionchus entomophagus]